MHKKTFDTIHNAISGQRALDDVASIIRYHRIQASPGHRAAAHHVLAELQKAGLEAHIETFAANNEARYWSMPSFQEWDATEGTLHLIEPADKARKLADYRELKVSLIQRSHAFEGEAEVVFLEDGTKPEDYEGLDLHGKIVLTKGMADRVRQLAVEKHGAIGIIFYGMMSVPPVREPIDVPDARQYTSFWWFSSEEKPCFGFVLSPRQGAWLSDVVRQRERDGESPVKVRAKVDAKLYDGELEVVTALIPGQTDEEVVVVSHLCHPQPSANDNASGVGAALEAARTMQQLKNEGKLPTPRRGIRFLWLPEMTGTVAYLSAHADKIPKMIAGVNLDMVGEDQSKTGSVHLIERPADSMSSFAPDLLERLREEFFESAHQSYTGLGGYADFKHAVIPFSGGSDHYIFSDPTVGVPMPMIIQWPDKFYHTSEDTLDKVDPEMLARAATLAASYAWFVADAGQTEATWLGHEMLSRFEIRVSRLAQTHITQVSEADSPAAARSVLEKMERQTEYALARFKEALQTLSRLSDGLELILEAFGEEATQLAARYLKRIRNLAATQIEASGADGLSEPPAEPNKWEQEAASLVPRRTYRGPAMQRPPEEDRDSWFKLISTRKGGRTLPVMAEYWVDGSRTVLEIIDLIELESSIRDAELIVTHFKILNKSGLLEW